MGTRSQAVHAGLTAVVEALQRLVRDRKLTVAEHWKLRSLMEERTSQHSFGGGQLRAAARELADLTPIRADQVVVGDRLFVITHGGLYSKWRDVAQVTHEDELCGFVYTDTGAEKFTQEVTLLRLPPPRDGSSAISELIGPFPAAGSRSFVPAAPKGEAKRKTKGAKAKRAPTGPWYILKVFGNKTTEDLEEGPFDTRRGAADFAANEYAGPVALLEGPPGTDEAFERERVRSRQAFHAEEPELDLRTDWYVLEVKPNRRAVDVGEGPWETEADARAFADANVGVDWVLFLAPVGTKDAFQRARRRGGHRSKLLKRYRLKLPNNRVADTAYDHLAGGSYDAVGVVRDGTVITFETREALPKNKKLHGGTWMEVARS